MFVKTCRKRILKGILAVLAGLCALLMLCPGGVHMPAEAASDADPQYMLKMRSGGAGNPGITYRLNVGKDKDIPEGTYVFSFEYYIDPTIASLEADARFFGAGYKKSATRTLTPGRNTMTLEYTYNSGDVIESGVLMPGVNAWGDDPNVDVYMWNFCLTVKGDATGKNYLADNGSFAGGKFNSWRPNDWNTCSDQSQEGSFAVLPFDSTLVEPYRDKQYMLKVDSSVGTGGFAKRFVLGSDVPAGTNTYVFSFEYYIDPASTGLMFGRYYNGSNDCIDHNNLYASGQHTFSKEYTIDSALGAFIVGLELRDSAPVYGYFWNFSLTIKGGDGTNYLSNFENYRFGDWDAGLSYAHSKDSGRYSIVEYDESLFVVPDDGKDYMLKMTNGGAGITYRLNVGTDIPEGTYFFSFDYYCDFNAAEINADARFFGGGYGKLRTAKLLPGRNTMHLEYTYAASDGQISPGVLMPGVNGASGDPDIYMWNFRLTVKGDETGTNYLTNFENRKFNGWRPGDQSAAEAAASGQFTVMEYDESLFVAPDDGKTYMLKMDLDKAVSSGQQWAALNVSEYAGTNLTTGEIPGTYTFSYDYFVQYSSDNGRMQSRIYAGGSADTNAVTYGALPAGRGNFSETFTVTEENPTFSLQLMAAEARGGVAYFWNLRLTKEGGTDNRLANNSLRKGTLKGWRYGNQYGYIADTDVEKEYFSVLEYDNALTTLYSLGTSVRGGNNPGLRFGFTIANQGIDYANPLNEDGTRTNYARGDLSQATVLVDGTPHRVLDMGVLISVHEDAVLAGINGGATKVEAKSLFEVQSGVATFTAVLVKIPENHRDTTVYACPYVQYETEDGSAYLYGTVLSDSYASALAKNPRASAAITV